MTESLHGNVILRPPMAAFLDSLLRTGGGAVRLSGETMVEPCFHL